MSISEFNEFIDVMGRELYVYRFARAVDGPLPDVDDGSSDARRRRRLVASARTRMRNSQTRIENAVLEFAQQISYDRFTKKYLCGDRSYTHFSSMTGRFALQHPAFDDVPRRLTPGTIVDDEELGTGGASSDS